MAVYITYKCINWNSKVNSRATKQRFKKDIYYIYNVNVIMLCLSFRIKDNRISHQIEAAQC